MPSKANAGAAPSTPITTPASAGPTTSVTRKVTCNRMLAGRARPVLQDRLHDGAACRAEEDAHAGTDEGQRIDQPRCAGCVATQIRASDSTPRSTSETTITCLRSQRSTKTPAIMPKSRRGTRHDDHQQGNSAGRAGGLVEDNHHREVA